MISAPSLTLRAASSTAAAKVEGAVQSFETSGYAHEKHGPSNAVVNAESDPVSSNALSRFCRWVGSFAIHGMGMFAESYFVFAAGNLTAVWKAEYPECWKSHTACPQSLADSIHYTQVCGIISGQLALGYVCDRIGRKWGAVTTAAFMVLFGILITAASGPSVHALFLMFTIVQFFFGIGVGGEYPVASTSANERAEENEALAKKRGQTVVLVFSMQGWGNLVNSLVLVILMSAFNQYGPAYDAQSLEIVWRLSYAIGLVPLCVILFYRLFFLQESKVWKGKRDALKAMGKDAEHGLTSRKLKLLLRHYWHRIGGTALCWFVWDFAFYGNKLFQSTFISVINPGASLLEVLQWTALNSAVALVGYYFAAFTIDCAWMGRKRMQIMGFAVTATLFLICGTAYSNLVKPEYIKLFQFMYYLSSFAGQWGPNATTWLLPAETMPTEVRSVCHGFSAAVGKAGALVAGVVFGMASNQAKFIISAVCGIIGVVCTVLFIPNLTGLDLKEGDRRWLAITEGKASAYKGEAVNPAHLSWLEIMMGYGSSYQADFASSGSMDASFCEFPQLQGGSHTGPAPPSVSAMRAHLSQVSGVATGHGAVASPRSATIAEMNAA